MGCAPTKTVRRVGAGRAGPGSAEPVRAASITGTFRLGHVGGEGRAGPGAGRVPHQGGRDVQGGREDHHRAVQVAFVQGVRTGHAVA